MPPKIKLIQGDITEFSVDAIVTAANSRLAGGGGVDGAVHRAAGEELLEACQEILRERGECLPGNAVLTLGYQLEAVRFVIHAVGPIWPEGYGADEDSDELNELKEQLYLAYQNSLSLAYENGCKSIAFPCISTGVYRFPKLIAARIAITAIKRFCEENPKIKEQLQEIYLVCFDEENYQVYYDMFS